MALLVSQNPFDTSADQDDYNHTPQWQRHLSSFDEMSTASSAADLPYASPSTDLEATSDQLGDAFVGDLQYSDERLEGVHVAVVPSSSSCCSETEQRLNTDVQLPHTPEQTSWELFHQPSDQDNPPLANDSGQWKARQSASTVAQVTMYNEVACLRISLKTIRTTQLSLKCSLYAVIKVSQ